MSVWTFSNDLLGFRERKKKAAIRKAKKQIPARKMSSIWNPTGRMAVGIWGKSLGCEGLSEAVRSYFCIPRELAKIL